MREGARVTSKGTNFGGKKAKGRGTLCGARDGGGEMTNQVEDKQEKMFKSTGKKKEMGCGKKGRGGGRRRR